jgi:hypothetical protein
VKRAIGGTARQRAGVLRAARAWRSRARGFFWVCGSMSTLQPNIKRSIDRRSNPVRVTLFLGKISEAETVAMVAYEDGTYDILRNDSPIEGHPWKADDLDGCIDAYLRIMRPGRSAV